MSRLPRHLLNLSPDAVVHKREIAALLGCTEQTAEGHMAAGKLHATKIGRDWVTTYDQVVAFIRSRSSGRANPTLPGADPPPNINGVIVDRRRKRRLRPVLPELPL